MDMATKCRQKGSQMVCSHIVGGSPSCFTESTVELQEWGCEGWPTSMTAVSRNPSNIDIFLLWELPPPTSCISLILASTANGSRGKGQRHLENMFIAVMNQTSRVAGNQSASQKQPADSSPEGSVANLDPAWSVRRKKNNNTNFHHFLTGQVGLTLLSSVRGWSRRIYLYMLQHLSGIGMSPTHCYSLIHRFL